MRAKSESLLLTKLPTKLLQKEEAIIALCHKLGVQKLILFGSQSRQDANAKSDYDFLVSFGEEKLSRPVTNLFAKFIELKEGLAEVLESRVDLIAEGSVRNPVFKKSIDADGLTVFMA